MLMLGSSTIVHALTQDHSQQNVLRSLVPASGLTITAFTIAVHASSRHATLADLVADAKSNPGKLRIGSYGVGTQSQMAAKLFSAATGIDVVHVSYRGGAPLAIDLLGRHIHAAFDTVANSLPHIKDGALRALAVTAPDRLKILPDIPAVAEMLPGYEMMVWTGIGLPRETPAAIVERLNREVKAALGEPEIVRKFAELAIEPMRFSVDEFRRFWDAETVRTRKLVDTIGTSPQ
jgi:tripartite-type tricarboxylate transporter receptor subunit TctC